jgi:hypothetical protein
MRAVGTPPSRSTAEALKACWTGETAVVPPKVRYFDYLPVSFFG